VNLKEANIRVVDFETTGFDLDTDKICEVGWCDVYFQKADYVWQCDEHHNEFINPGRDIPATAKAVHHITEKMVENAQLADELLPAVFAENIDLFAAHNAEFDSSFADAVGFERRWLCTYRRSLHRIVESPSHKNQVLRYHLGFDDIEGDAHRAGHDAKVTAEILCYMLNQSKFDHTIDSIIAYAENPVFLRGNIGFGKWRDRKWTDVPTSYLQWMRKQGEFSEHNPDGWDRDQWYTLNKVLQS